MFIPKLSVWLVGSLISWCVENITQLCVRRENHSILYAWLVRPLDSWFVAQITQLLLRGAGVDRVVHGRDQRGQDGDGRRFRRPGACSVSWLVSLFVGQLLHRHALGERVVLLYPPGDAS